MKAGVMIAGRGNMARVLTTLCQEDPLREFFEFSGKGTSCPNPGGMVAIHFGSGKELPSLIDWCTQYGVPLIQGSTGQTLPDKILVPVVDAPNLSLPVVKLLSQVLPDLKKVFGDMEVTITESHQATKKSVPGTAKVMAKVFGLSEKDIVSIREPEIQRQLGIPEEGLTGHGYHWINFQGQGVNITLSTKVNGRRTYAEGALSVADALLGDGEIKVLKNGVSQLTDILWMLSG